MSATLAIRQLVSIVSRDRLPKPLPFLLLDRERNRPEHRSPSSPPPLPPPPLLPVASFYHEPFPLLAPNLVFPPLPVTCVFHRITVAITRLIAHPAVFVDQSSIHA
ncbi:hypothetical protein NL676_008612 [Syzygium grande]|nr:hypothetical protein NL676_008612 [Syzygium grande]